MYVVILLLLIVEFQLSGMCDIKEAFLSLSSWVINVITTVIPPVRAGIAGALKVILTPLWLVTQISFMQNFPEKKNMSYGLENTVYSVPISLYFVSPACLHWSVVVAVLYHSLMCR